MSRIRFPRNWQGAAIAFLAAAISISCGTGANHLNSTSTNPVGSLGVSSSSLDFGNVAVGGSATKSVTLTNSSVSVGATITVSQVTTTGTGFSVSTSSLPVTLNPGDNLTISVAFKPKSAGDASGMLSISVDGQADPATVPLSGTGLASGQLAVSPSTLNFGSVTVGGSKNLSGTLSAGNAGVTVSSASWNGQGFAVSGISFPVTIAAGKSVSFTVSFSPQAAGSASGNISFISDASNSPTGQKLSGTGTSTSPSSQHSVTLSWEESSSVAGYYVYRGTQSGGPYSRLNSSAVPTTSYTDSTVQGGQTYYYVVTSVDSSGNESSYSGEVSATIPSP
ncbi:MAG TPA: choice-of-anchor D domain-containing protein [Terriglobales bacterium]|nr:choice-of-anchor D domain-containing protein [Terriglobales bacterium]